MRVNKLVEKRAKFLASQMAKEIKKENEVLLREEAMRLLRGKEFKDDCMVAQIAYMSTRVAHTLLRTIIRDMRSDKIETVEDVHKLIEETMGDLQNHVDNQGKDLPKDIRLQIDTEMHDLLNDIS